MFSALGQTIRLTLLAGLTASVGVGAWLGYRLYDDSRSEQETIAQQLDAIRKKDDQLAVQQRTIDGLNDSLTQSQADLEQKKLELAEKIRQVQRLEAANRLLKVERRVAQLRVLKQQERDGKKFTTVEFVELDPLAEGEAAQPLDAPRAYEIEGDIVHVTAHVIKFDDKFVEAGDDPLRAASLCLFRRLYGEFQKPSDGFPLDPIGQRPKVYGGQSMSELETDLWAHFWDYANNLEKQTMAGVRAAHGEAVFTKVLPQRAYPILLRSSGGLSIGAPKPLSGPDVPKS